MSRFCGPRSIQCPGFTSGLSASDSKPGSRVSSVVVGLSIDIPFLRLLSGWEARERAWWHIVCDDRSGIDPCVVADLDRGEERIVDAGSDVTPDRGSTLGPARAVREVGG